MNKCLGQHFLKNKSALKKIADSIPLKKGDLVIEIGPGSGALTYPLLKKVKECGAKLIAIEKDRRLALKLYQDIAKKEPNFEIKEGDILEKLEALSKKQPNYHIAGNIPYYISGRLLRIISELENKAISTTLTIQNEVAEKIVSKKGGGNLLSTITGAWANSKILMRLKADDFSPPPNVHSAIIQLKTKENLANPKELNKYFSFLKSCFKQPKKTLLNNLSESYKDIEKAKILDFIKKQNLDEKSRAKDLDNETLMRLFADFPFSN